MYNIKKIGIILIILSFFVSACGPKKQTPAVIQDNSLEFEGKLFEYNEIYKTALLSISQNKVDVEDNIQKSLSTWLVIVDQYTNEQPLKYQKTQNWKEKLTEISEIQTKTVQMLVDKKNQEAVFEFEKIRTKLKEIWAENGIKNINYDIIVFHDLVEDLVKIKKMEDIGDIKLRIKPEFQNLQAYSLNQEYTDLVSDIEQILIPMLDSQANFDKAKEPLEKAIRKLYFRFG